MARAFLHLLMCLWQKGIPNAQGSSTTPPSCVFSPASSGTQVVCVRVRVCKRERRLLVPNQSLEHLDHFQGTESPHDLRNQKHSNCQHTSILSPLSFH